MALLKSGSTVGGNLIWHQGILPLFPANESLYWKNYKVYTTQDKPTTTELNVYSKPEINASRQIFENRTSALNWYKVGTLTGFGQGGEIFAMEIYGGQGYNGNARQTEQITVSIKTGNGDAAVGVNAVGRANMKIVRSRSSLSTGIIVDAALIETSANNYDVYFRLGPFTNNTFGVLSNRMIIETSQKWVRFYTDAFKPTNADVGLGNVTNDAQVKKAGDTMTGKLTVNNAIDVRDASVFRGGVTVTGSLSIDKLTVPTVSSFGINTTSILGVNSIAIGDSDTGLRQISDGVLQGMANNSAVFQIAQAEFRSLQNVKFDKDVVMASSTGTNNFQFLKSGANPKNFRMYHTGDATRGGRLEFAGEGEGHWIAYLNQAPDNTKSMEVNGYIVAHNYIKGVGAVYSGDAVFQTDGNINGSIWGGYLSAYINNQDNSVRARADDAWNKANDGQNNRVNEMQRGPQQFQPKLDGWGEWECPHGYITGYSNHTDNGDIKYSGWYYRVPQIHVPGRGWTEIWNQ